jgi:hypothetical protein
MADRKHNKNKPLKLSNGFSRETARLRYENLQNDPNEDRGEPFEDPVETKIKAAMADGAFDNLPGKGKPLDLKGYMETPEHLRTGYHILKNAGYMPEEVRLKKEMEAVKERIRLCSSKDEKIKLNKVLADISQQFNFYMEYNKKFRK